MFCSYCRLEMMPVELKNVPIEDINRHMSVDGNKLEDNWYFCTECGSFEQKPLPTAKLSPEVEKQNQELESILDNWWL